MYGHTGKILKLDLTTGQVSTINTSDYEEWGGGHGIGSAIFWDLCEDKTIDGFDPRNVVTLMTGPLGGTVTPAGGARTEVQGIGVYAYPTPWFQRSNFGGRFAVMLKYAGWDGIVITGKASAPVWINIVNDTVTIEDASGLWGLDTWETQEAIWRQIAGGIATFGVWKSVGDTYTTQRPAVVTIGPAGENLSRIGSLIHDAGQGAGQGGFGGIFGSKNLKAISVLGTGSVEVADPQELLAARLWMVREHSFNVDDPNLANSDDRPGAPYWEPNRASGCQSCSVPCVKKRTRSRYNDSMCVESYWYPDANHEPALMTEPEMTTEQVQYGAVEWVQRYGVNAYDINFKKTQRYLPNLYTQGVLGPGKEIESSPLHFEEYGTARFAKAYVLAIAHREGIGDDLAEGILRASERWGRVEEALEDGLIPAAQWGFMWHWNLPGVHWTYGSLMDSRDINAHTFKFSSKVPVEELVNIWAEKTVPFTGDPLMFDYGTGSTGIYSEHKAKMIAWYRYQSAFWLGSAGFCDWRYPRIVNTAKPDFRGFTPDLEERCFNAVTGEDKSYADYMELGRKIINLDRAIHVLQGRHRDNEKLAPFIFKYKDRTAEEAPGSLFPFFENGQWDRKRMRDRFLDEAGVEEWKTHYYNVEGWDTATGYPTRSTLEDLGLGNVADEMATAGKLGT